MAKFQLDLENAEVAPEAKEVKTKENDNGELEIVKEKVTETFESEVRAGARNARHLGRKYNIPTLEASLKLIKKTVAATEKEVSKSSKY